MHTIAVIWHLFVFFVIFFVLVAVIERTVGFPFFWKCFRNAWNGLLWFLTLFFDKRDEYRRKYRWTSPNEKKSKKPVIRRSVVKSKTTK